MKTQRSPARHRRQPRLLAVVMVASGVSGVVLAAPETPLPEIRVLGESAWTAGMPATEQPRSEESVDAEGIRIYSGAAQTNAYKALSGLPSVMFESADAYGLSASRSLRSRGRPNSSQLPGQTYEGMPIRNLGGFTGSVDLFDLENVAALDFYRGAVPVDKGLGFANASGSVDMRFLAPAEQFGARVDAAVGGDGFRRLFGRVDTGMMASGARAFFSASHTEADKWRGTGGAPKGRENAQVGLFLPLPGKASLEVSALHNEQQQHNYRPLSHAQTADKGNYRNFDYATGLTGVAAQDINYQGFNRQESSDTVLFGILRFGDEERSGFVKAYRFDMSGMTLNGASGTLGAPGVVRWDYESAVYGVVAQGEALLSREGDRELRGKFGYWHHVQEPPGPPLHQKAYRIAADGRLSFAGWSTLAKMSNHVFNSPYASLEGKAGAWSWTAGLRYLDYRTPAITYYNGAGMSESPYGEAFSQNPATSPDRAAASRNLRSWLPNLGVSYVFHPTARGYVNFGRNYGVPAFGIATTYNAARPQFAAAGASLQDLWNKAGQELSDNLDLGLHLTGSDWYLSPVLYAARYRNRAVLALDPALGVSYSQNTGKAESRGLEIEGGWLPTSRLTLFGGLSLSRFEFSEDTQAVSASVLATRGKKVADSPTVMLKLGATYRVGEWALTPTARHVGSRFGNALNTEKVAAYTVADLNLSYTRNNVAGFRQLTAGLAVTNLFDRRYIGIIGSNDVDLRGGATYYPGAPRTLALTLSARY